MYLPATDLVVLPYRDILNSGSAVLALSFDRPVLVPRRGSLGDLQNHVGRQWVRTYEGDIGAAELEAASRPGPRQHNTRAPAPLVRLNGTISPDARSKRTAQILKDGELEYTTTTIGPDPSSLRTFSSWASQ